MKYLKKLKYKNIELKEEYSKISHYKDLLDNAKRLSFYHSLIHDINNNDNIIGNKLSLINLAMNLYEELSTVTIHEVPNTFIWKHSLKKEKIILDILRYAERIVIFLYEEKKRYFSDKTLKMQYKSVAEEVEKNTKNKKMQKQMEIQAKLLLAKKEKIQMKLNNKINFKPFRKVDFQYYLREKSKNKHIPKVKNEDEYLQYFFY